MSEPTEQTPISTPTLVAWAQNYAQIFQLILKIHKVLLHQLPEQSQLYDLSTLEQVVKEQMLLMQSLLSDPKKLWKLQTQYTKDYAKLFKHFFYAWNGIPIGDAIKVPSEDKRFKDTSWENNPIFAFIKQNYLLTSKYLSDLVYTADKLDPAVSKKLKFYMHQFVDALSPSNFILTNPEVLRVTMETAGGNLALGLEKMLNDLKENEGRFKIRMTDTQAFQIGKDLAITPGKVIFQNRLFQLIQYEPMTEKVHKIPLLVFPPWINKFYILDLRPKNSLVRHLLNEGHTVFMVSWVNPDASYAETTFDDYMLEGALKAVEVVEEITNEKKINVMAYCIGGTLVGCLLAYLAAKKRNDINCVTFLATLLDFSDPGDIQVFIDEPQLKTLEKNMHKKGYLDGRDMALTFNTLRANDLIWSYFVNNYLSGKEPFALDLLFWNNDVTNLPAPAHAFYLREFYLNNNLGKPGAITLGGVPLDLSKVDIPVYAVATESDHIAPWRTVYEGLKPLPGEKHFVRGGSGHIAGIINPPESNKYSYRSCEEVIFMDNPDDCLPDISEVPGSWWPDWFTWLATHAGHEIPARKLGSKKYPDLEDAPGSYVMKKVGSENDRK